MQQILDAPSEDKKITEYAGFWIRVAATLIDSIVLAFVQYMILSFILASSSITASSTIEQLSLAVVGVLYYTFMESSTRQGTLGKLAVGIKVGDADGNRISWLNALGRYFGKIVSSVILLIGFIMVAFDDRKQGLHDKIAGTYVFYSK